MSVLFSIGASRIALGSVPTTATVSNEDVQKAVLADSRITDLMSKNDLAFSSIVEISITSQKAADLILKEKKITVSNQASAAAAVATILSEVMTGDHDYFVLFEDSKCNIKFVRVSIKISSSSKGTDPSLTFDKDLAGTAMGSAADMIVSVDQISELIDGGSSETAVVKPAPVVTPTDDNSKAADEYYRYGGGSYGSHANPSVRKYAQEAYDASNWVDQY